MLPLRLFVFLGPAPDSILYVIACLRIAHLFLVKSLL